MTKKYSLEPADFSSKETVNTNANSTQNLTKDNEGSEERGHWGNRAEFLLSCIGLSVGLGNVWRFPVLAYENGGAAFLIPYIILQLLIGKPMYFMELIMGQFSGLGPTGVWKMNPAAKGIGISMMLISLIVAIYYNVVMAYTLYYFFATMQTTLPWTNCKEEWIERNCSMYIGSGRSMPKCDNSTVMNGTMCKCSGKIGYDFDSSSSCFNSSLVAVTNYTALADFAKNNCSSLQICTNNTRTAAHFYFYEDVIKQSDSIGNLGNPIWYLALCLLLSWIVVVLCLIKGVKSSGKVVYFTATFPYVILIVLLIGGAIQEGSLTGVRYFLIPDWSKLLDIQVWRAAAGQMFFSLSVSFGGIIMFGSYNRLKHNVYIDALIISTMDIVTSFISGLVIFTTLGAMAHASGSDIKEVAKGGYGLAFVAYPEALSFLPAPHVWSLLFFFMLFTLGLDSEFALLETVLTCLQDEIPRLRKRKWLLCIVSGIICYFLALPIVTPAGDWILNLMDNYGATIPVLVVAFCEVIAVNWVYRVDRFMSDVQYCLGYCPHPHFYWMFCWAISAPVLILAIFILSMVYYKPLSYGKGLPNYEPWAQAIGWIIVAVVLIPIPINLAVAISQVNASTILDKFLKAHMPTEDWGPQPHDDNTWENKHYPQRVYNMPRVTSVAPNEKGKDQYVNTAYDSTTHI